MRAVDASAGAVVVRARPGTLRRYLPAGLALLDAGLIYAAFVLAYWIRYSLKAGPQIHDQIAFGAYQPLAVLLLGTMMPILVFKGAYRPRMTTEIADEFAVIFSTATITVAAIVVITAMLQQYQYSRGVIVYLWVLLVVLLALSRGVVRQIQGWAHRHGWGVRRLLVVGGTDVGKMVMQGVMSRRDLGYHLVGFVDHREAPHVRDFGRFRALGTLDDIPSLVEQHLVDDVIIAVPGSAHEAVWPVLRLCEQHGVGVKIVPDLFETSLSRVQVDDIAGIPLLDVREQPLRRVARSAKRALDILVSAVVLVVTAPLALVLALLIRVESSGPALLRQQRVGLGGRLFTCLKFRTMRVDAPEGRGALQTLNEADGPLFKIRDDPRCTRVGRVMRRWSLDELPQLWNVLVGEMSLVGPRPPLPLEVAQYDDRHMRRLDIKPGMTGIWQVSGRSDLPFDEMVMMDTYYVDNWSLAMDVKILTRTVVAVLGRHGAY